MLLISLITLSATSLITASIKRHPIGYMFGKGKCHQTDHCISVVFTKSGLTCRLMLECQLCDDSKDLPAYSVKQRMLECQTCKHDSKELATSSVQVNIKEKNKCKEGYKRITTRTYRQLCRKRKSGRKKIHLKEEDRQVRDGHGEGEGLRGTPTFVWKKGNTLHLDSRAFSGISNFGIGKTSVFKAYASRKKLIYFLHGDKLLIKDIISGRIQTTKLKCREMKELKVYEEPALMFFQCDESLYKIPMNARGHLASQPISNSFRWFSYDRTFKALVSAEMHHAKCVIRNHDKSITLHEEKLCEKAKDPLALKGNVVMCVEHWVVRIINRTATTAHRDCLSLMYFKGDVYLHSLGIFSDDVILVLGSDEFAVKRFMHIAAHPGELVGVAEIITDPRNTKRT